MSWCLLIVEDDLDVADALAEVFATRGYRVRAVGNGAQAMAVVRGEGLRPDAILLDLLMPVMNGVEFMSALEREPLLVDVPVIVTSAQPELARDRRVYALLGKPLALGVLVETVHRAVHRMPPDGSPDRRLHAA